MTSKIKVDNINKVSDDSNIINKCGTTVTVGAASDGVRTGADNLQAADGGNLISQSGTTITLGASGDTITLASGASQTGFGRTGTVDWQTSSIKTATFTAANGEGYFANTSGGAFTMNLPAGSAGAIVSVQDYNNTFDSNSLTITPNGSEKINSGAGSVTLSTEGEGLTLVYIDGTVGWRSIQDSAFADVGSVNLTATGGTITTSGDCKIHTFTGPGTFTVSAISGTPADNTVSYLVIGGGGGGGGTGGGGGAGAGGYREVKSPSAPYCASALDGYPSAPNRVTVTAQAYPITVGAGGAGGTGCGPGGGGTAASGANSIFSTITSAGGGFGGTRSSGGPQPQGQPGGSGGGNGRDAGNGTGGSGNAPPVSPPQGQNGGGSPGTNSFDGGGGGGAGGTGGAGALQQAGNGGNGIITAITAAPVIRAGGGGGGSDTAGDNGAAGPGGGGTGGKQPGTASGSNGTDNTGGGGGASGETGNGGTGGSGIVVIRYKFQ
jgi:hypothetical protein